MEKGNNFGFQIAKGNNLGLQIAKGNNFWFHIADELVESGSNQENVDTVLLSQIEGQLAQQEGYAASTYGGSVDQTDQDPDTLIANMPQSVKSASSVKSVNEEQENGEWHSILFHQWLLAYCYSQLPGTLGSVAIGIPLLPPT